MGAKSQFELLERIERYLNLAKHSSLPKEAYFQITKACNGRCKMCKVWQEHHKNPPLEQILNIIHALRDKAFRWVTLWGGEPYMHPDIARIMEEVKLGGMKLQLITNGTLLTPETLSATHQFADNVVFSIDAPCAEIHDRIRSVRGFFNKAVANVHGLAALNKKYGKGPGIELDTTVTKYNILTLEEMIEFSKQFGDILVDYDPAQCHGVGNNEDKSVIDIPPEITDKVFDALIARAGNGAHITSPAKLELIRQYLKGQPMHGSCYSLFKDLLLSPEGDAHFCWGWDKVIGDTLNPDIEERWQKAVHDNIAAVTGELEKCKGCGFSHVRWPDPGFQQIIEGINSIRKADMIRGSR